MINILMIDADAGLKLHRWIDRIHCLPKKEKKKRIFKKIKKRGEISGPEDSE